MRWLASETQLGVAPDEVEHRGMRALRLRWGQWHRAPVRLQGATTALVAPSGGGWSERSGRTTPPPRSIPGAESGFTAFSLYLPEDDDSLAAHVLALAEALAVDLPGEAAGAPPSRLSRSSRFEPSDRFAAAPRRSAPSATGVCRRRQTLDGTQ